MKSGIRIIRHMMPEKPYDPRISIHRAWNRQVKDDSAYLMHLLKMEAGWQSSPPKMKSGVLTGIETFKYEKVEDATYWRTDHPLSAPWIKPKGEE